MLLEYTGDGKTQRRQLAQRDMAIRGGIDWQKVHESLKSLQFEGAIRVERARIVINKELLQKVAERD